jgi:hypothetical protein
MIALAGALRLTREQSATGTFSVRARWELDELSVPG